MLRDHLDPFPPAKACLALTCPYLLDIIGIDSLLIFDERHSGIRQEFLTQLLIPGYYYCHTYSILRPFSKGLVSWEDEELWNRDMLFEDIWFQDKRFPERHLSSHPHRAYGIHLPTGALYYSRWETRYQLRYIHLQLAMRRHRLGPEYGIGLDNLSLIEVVEVPDKSKGTVLSSFEARIGRHDDDNGEQEEYLYSRIQTCIYLPEYSRDIHCYLLRTVDNLCQHQPHSNPFRYTDGYVQYDNLITKIFPMLVDRNERGHYNYISSPVYVHEGTWPSESGCYECPQCDLNFQICVKRPAGTRKETLAITVTRWYRLGQGKNPRETQWMRHLHNVASNSTGYCLRNGAARQEFEEVPGLSQTELMTRNFDLMLSKDYRSWQHNDSELFGPVYFYPGNYVPQTHPGSDQSQSENLAT